MLEMNNPPDDDVDRWMLMRKSSLDAEVMRQIEGLADQLLPRLRYAGVVYVNLEDVALHRITPNSVLLEIGSQDMGWLRARSAELRMAVLTTFCGLFDEFDVPRLCELNCESGQGCCLGPVWRATRNELLASIAGYVIRTNLVGAALARIMESRVLNLELWAPELMH